MNNHQVDKIHANAAGARGAYNAFCAGLDAAQLTLFRRCFHLRPCAGGVRIVSTLDYAPMSTAKVKVPGLGKALDRLGADMPKLTGADRRAAVVCLKKHGFRRGSSRLAPENALRAAFIRGMRTGECGYQGVEFLASGLCLDKKAPFALMGVRERCLYLFCLSAQTDARAVSQAEIARGLVLDPLGGGRQKQNYERVLRDWPDASFEGFDSVVCTAVISGGSLSPAAMESWARDNNAGGVNLWFYEIGPRLTAG